MADPCRRVSAGQPSGRTDPPVACPVASPPVPSPQRAALRPVRLSDVPFGLRMSAARQEAKRCVTRAEVDDLLFAALFPSERVYWIREAA